MLWAKRTPASRVCAGLAGISDDVLLFSEQGKTCEGLMTMIAHSDALECRIDASAPGQLEGLKGALARHLDRFAFREAPLTFEWAGGCGHHVPK